MQARTTMMTKLLSRGITATVVLLLVGPLTGCGQLVGSRHDLTFEVTGSAPVAQELTVDPPGEQDGNAERRTQVPLPWSTTQTTGYGFARLSAVAEEGALTCRILDGDRVIAQASSDSDGTVTCHANVQDA